MPLHEMQLAELGLDGPKKGKQKAPSPGLTGADLEMAKAQSERATADKVAGTATTDFMRGGGYSLGHGSYAGPPPAMRAFDRQQAANGAKDDADANIRNLVAAVAHLSKHVTGH